MQGPQVQSLVRELRAHIRAAIPKKKSEKRHKISSLKERANQGGTHMLQRNLFFFKNLFLIVSLK